MPLTDIGVRNAKTDEKPYKLADGGGMYLLVQPNGSKYWRMAYRSRGKQKLLALGVYPEVGLADARKARDDAKQLIKRGVAPMIDRRQEKLRVKAEQANSFEAVAREWHEMKKGGWTTKHAEKILNSLKADIFPVLGDRPVVDITPPELLHAVPRHRAAWCLGNRGTCAAKV